MPEALVVGVVRQALETAILNVIRSRGNGLPFPLVLGVLRLVEHRLLSEAEAP